MLKMLMDGQPPGLDEPLKPSEIVLEPGGVRRHRNLCYVADAPKRDRIRHLLDLFLPADHAWKPGRPLMIWVHGGGWRIGSKDDLMGLYGRTAHVLATKGIAVANVNYRLTPRVQHPGHVQDVARAVAWLQRSAALYGYDGENIYLSGHSAGAHLSSLLATDSRWLEAHELDPRTHISGVIASSGVYELDGLRDFLSRVTATTDVPFAAHPLDRSETLMPFKEGDLADASPVNHVSSDTPRFLLVYEELWPYMKTQAHAMARRLAEHGVKHRVVQVDERDHISMLIDMLVPGNVTIDAIERFIT